VFRRILAVIIFALPFCVLIYYGLISAGLVGNFAENRPFMVFRDMHNQPARQALSESKFFSDSASYRVPPENSVPIGKQKYAFHQTEFDSAIANFTNPIQYCPTAFDRGKLRYETFCVHCHGVRGDATGPVITQVELTGEEEGFPAPPTYLRPETRALPDARIFHIISSGQNAMFPVADRLSVTDRWCIVHYIRHLQGLR
jgi:hypothetical protein